MMKTHDGSTRRINLALQGGGAHGAFAWGVLDRLLENEDLEFDGISATSAGAMNASVLAHGWLQGGRRGARQALAAFWADVGKAAARYSPYRQTWLDRLHGNGFSLDHSPAYMMMDMASRLFSPYQLNLLNFNPLRQVLARHVDFAALRRHSPIKLFICATNVETGKARIFPNAELSIEAILASACLPFMFQAVEVDGEHYWDGGYIGNPAIFPLIYDCDSRDVLVVHINPIVREGVPTSAADILNRINEISFNSSLLREMRAIAFVTSLIQRGKIEPGEMREVLVHSIRTDESMADLGVSSKLNASPEFLQYLFARGRDEADAWLGQHYDNLGVRSSVDVRAEFL